MTRFVCSFPTTNETKGSEEHFKPHPTSKGAHGIGASGLKLLSRHIRGFLCRRRDLIGLRWNSSHTQTILPASPEEVKRALEIALFRADASATDELMNGARNRVIARHMPKHTLYDFSADSYVRSKDFYLAMRETNPGALNVSKMKFMCPIRPK